LKISKSVGTMMKMQTSGIFRWWRSSKRSSNSLIIRLREIAP